MRFEIGERFRAKRSASYYETNLSKLAFTGRRRDGNPGVRSLGVVVGSIYKVIGHHEGSVYVVEFNDTWEFLMNTEYMEPLHPLEQLAEL